MGRPSQDAAAAAAAGGGRLFTRDQEQASGGRPFPACFSAMVLITVAFMTGLYLASTAKARQHIRGGVWIVATFLVTLLVAYGGQLGPMTEPSLGNQTDILIMVLIALGSFFWSVSAGDPAEELAALLAAEKAKNTSAVSQD